MIVCKDGCFALHTVYTNCQLRAGLPAIRGAHGATAHNARSHGKCACYPTENAHAIRRENAHAIHVKMRMLSDVD